MGEDEVVDLVLRYQHGEGAALELLHDRLGPIILSMLRPYRTAELPSAMSFQDVAQQTWIVLADLAERWRPEGSFLAYFFRSFPRALRRYVSVAGAHRGSKQAQVISVPYDELLRAADARGGLDHETDGLLWRQQMEALPAEQRVVLTMRVLDGESFDAIGSVLGISRASAHRLYRRAVATLGETAERQPGADEGAAPGEAAPTEGSDVERLVRALHALAGPGGEIVGRRRAARAAGLGRARFTQLMAELEAAGAIVGRAPGQAGRLVDASPAETLSRLAARQNRG